MPYIQQHRRRSLYHAVEIYPQTVGELNYVISRLCNEYLLRNTHNYETMNAIIGVLESAKLELYRRVVAPYENDKCQENGDVY